MPVPTITNVLPVEILTAICKCLFQDSNNYKWGDIAPGVRLNGPDPAILGVCKMLRQIGLNCHHRFTLLDIDRHALGRLSLHAMVSMQVKFKAPDMTVHSIDDARVIQNFPQLFPNLRHLCLRFVERDAPYDSWSEDEDFIVLQRASWRKLEFNPIEAMTCPSRIVNAPGGDFPAVLDLFWFFSPRIPDLIVEFNLLCQSLLCKADPEFDHQFRASYIMRNRPRNLLYLDHGPVWDDNVTWVNGGPFNCGCPEKFAKKHFKVYHLDAPKPAT